MPFRTDADQVASPPASGATFRSSADQVAAPAQPGLLDRIRGAAQESFSALATDAQRYYKTASTPTMPKSPVELIPGMSRQEQQLGSVIADAGAYAVSPVAAVQDAVITQPAARVLDKLPAPHNTHVEWHGIVPHEYVDGQMTPEQQHAANEDAVNKALLAIGPKGMKAGDLSGEIFSRYAGKVAGVVKKLPPEVALDDAGNLTAEAQEHAAQAGAHADDVKAMYHTVRDNPPAPEAAPAAGEAAQAEAGVAPARPGEIDQTATPTMPQEVAPGATVAPEAALTPETSPTQPEPYAFSDEPPSAPAQARLADARSEGVDLSRGQATQDFDTQAKEDALRGTDGRAQAFFAKQAQQISAAVDRFKQALGNSDATAAERGQVVRDALTSLRDTGKAGVTALYEQARKLAEGLGEQGSNLIHLDTAPILDRIKQILIDEGVDPKVRSALRQQAAQYGLIGDGQRVFEDGSASVKLRGVDGEPGPSIQLQRPQEPLTIINAEKLRQFINGQFLDDKTAALQNLKPLLDNAVQAAVERAASEGTGEVGQAFKDARAGHASQRATFKGGDVVQKLLDWKRGTNAPSVLPENVIKTILAGGKDAVTELKKVKALLLSNPTEQSRAAWAAIKAHAVEGIFDKALTLNANPGGGALGSISGAKLNTEIAKFGGQRLKIVLGETDFNQLMKLKRIIGDATIPIQKTTNPSGSGYAVMRFLGQQGIKVGSGALHFVPVVGKAADAALGLYKVGKDAAEAGKTLEGIESFTPEAAAKAAAKAKK